MSGRSVNLTTLFLGRLRSLKRLTKYCVHILSPVTDTAPLESGETKVYGQTEHRTQDLFTYESGALPTALRGPAAFVE